MFNSADILTRTLLEVDSLLEPASTGHLWNCSLWLQVSALEAAACVHVDIFWDGYRSLIPANLQHVKFNVTSRLSWNNLRDELFPFLIRIYTRIIGSKRQRWRWWGELRQCARRNADWPQWAAICPPPVSHDGAEWRRMKTTLFLEVLLRERVWFEVRHIKPCVRLGRFQKPCGSTPSVQMLLHQSQREEAQCHQTFLTVSSFNSLCIKWFELLNAASLWILNPGLKQMSKPQVQFKPTLLLHNLKGNSGIFKPFTYSDFTKMINRY